MKILKLTLHRRWFIDILNNDKKTEYREVKKYWRDRLCHPDGSFRVFDEVLFINGYGRHRPWMRVEWKGCGVGNDPEGVECYCTALGEVIASGNINAL